MTKRKADTDYPCVMALETDTPEEATLLTELQLQIARSKLDMVRQLDHIDVDDVDSFLKSLIDLKKPFGKRFCSHVSAIIGAFMTDLLAYHRPEPEKPADSPVCEK
jgi:hypothetical protein